MNATTRRMAHRITMLAVCAGLLGLIVSAAMAQEDGPAKRRALAQQMQKRYASDAATLSITGVEASATDVPVFSRLELRFSVAGRFTNPFDPDEIRVDGHIIQPDGSTVTVPTFFMEPYESADGHTRLEGNVKYRRASGEAGWRLRFTPTQPGEHKVQLTATLPARAQFAEAPMIAFNAASPGKQKSLGFVRVSKANPQYFENTADGSLFYASGVNVPWTRTDKNDPKLGLAHGNYEYYFGKAEGQMSATRVWQCHYGWIEWMPMPEEPEDSSWRGYGGLTSYNQMVSAAFDRVFELAEKSGLRVMLVLDDNDEHDDKLARHAWPFNPYNRINGGPCAKPQDIFTSPEARRAYRARLRYVLARWGYSPSLWAINTWNDCVSPTASVLSWLREMHGYAHDVAGGWRPVIFGTNYKYEAQVTSDYAQALASGIEPGKPNVVQEAYFTREMDWFVDTLRLQLWENLARGCGGVMVWPHPIVDMHDAWPTFAGVLTFIEDIPLNREGFLPINAKITAGSAGGSAGTRAIAASSYGDIPRWGVRASAERFEIDLSAGSQFLMGMAPKLYGQRKERAAWRTEPVFAFELPAPGRLMIEVGEMSGDGMTLAATDGGAPLVELALPGSGRRTPPPGDRFLSIALPPGRHEVKLSLEGPVSDWIDVRRLLLVYEEPDPTRLLDVKALGTDRYALAYIRNASTGELMQQVLRQAATRVDDAQLVIPGLSPGRYEAVIFDIDAGTVMQPQAVRATDQPLRVALPPIERHLAVKVLPVQE